MTRRAVLIAYVVALGWLGASLILAALQPAAPTLASTGQLLEGVTGGRVHEVTFVGMRDGTYQVTWSENARTWQAVVSSDRAPALRSAVSSAGAQVRDVSSTTDPGKGIVVALSLLFGALVVLIVPLALLIDELLARGPVRQKILWLAAIIYLPILGVLARLLLWPAGRSGRTFFAITGGLGAVAAVVGIILAVNLPHGAVLFQVSSPAHQ